MNNSALNLTKTEFGLITTLFRESVKLCQKAGFKISYEILDFIEEVHIYVHCDSLNPFYFIAQDLFNKGFYTSMQFNSSLEIFKDKPYFITLIVSRALPF